MHAAAAGADATTVEVAGAGNVLDQKGLTEQAARGRRADRGDQTALLPLNDNPRSPAYPRSKAAAADPDARSSLWISVNCSIT